MVNIQVMTVQADANIAVLLALPQTGVHGPIAIYVNGKLIVMHVEVGLIQVVINGVSIVKQLNIAIRVMLRQTQIQLATMIVKQDYSNLYALLLFCSKHVYENTKMQMRKVI